MGDDTKRPATMPAYQRNEAVARIARRYKEETKKGNHAIAEEHKAAGIQVAWNGRTEAGAMKAWEAAVRKDGFT